MANSSTPSQPEIPERRGDARLDSWKEIAAYFDREVRTVQRWEKNEGLPVHRHFHDKLGTVYAYRAELDAWWRDRRAKIEKEEQSADPELKAANGAKIPAEIVGPQAEIPPPAARDTTGRHLRLPSWVRPFVLGLAVAVAIGFYFFRDRIWPKHQGRVVLAVMPFKNLTDDPEQQYFVDGLTEEMIARLGRLHPEQMGVIALTPPYTRVPVNQIGKELGVDYVLEGSVRRAGQRVAITAQLVKVKDQTRTWADSYERDLRDILSIQGEVATAIANEILTKLPRPGSSAARQVDREAYEAYLRGRFFWGKRTTENLTKALAYFQQAIEKDPTYAPAYAGLADCYSLLGSAPYTGLPPKEAFPKAEFAAQKALEMDETLAEAHVSLGYAKLAYEWDFPAAQREFERALQLRLSDATAHQFYAYYLTAVGRLEEAIAERKKAQELDPLSPLLTSALGEAYYQAHQFDRTIEQNKKALELDPSFAVGLINLGRAYVQKGMHEQARERFEKILAVAPNDPGVLGLLGYEYAVSGDTTAARRILSQLQDMAKRTYVPSLYVAAIYTGLGDLDQSFQWLDKAYEERCEYLVYLQTEPMADPLRHDPRFVQLLQRLGLTRGKN